MNTIAKFYSKSQDRNVGIDVGKASLDIFIFELDLHWQVANTPLEIRSLLIALRRYKLTRIVVEATGGYERALVEACAAKAFPIIVVQPAQIRQFAKAQGLLAKTDKLDAHLIAQFGAVMRPEPRPLPSQNVRKVRELLARKRQLNEARTKELNRQQQATQILQASHARLIKIYNKEIAWLNIQLERAVAAVTDGSIPTS
jgi:transposase